MLPLVVALNVATTVAIEDRTEVRGRLLNSPRIDRTTDLPFVDPATRAFKENDNKTAWVMDLETDPVARLRVAHEEDAFTLSYAPRIVVANFGNAGQAQGGETTLDLIHRPALTLEKQLDPRTRLVGNALVQFGSTTPSTLLMSERWNGEDRPNIPRAFPALPYNQQTFLAIYAAAGVAHQFSSRLTATLSAFYITFGQPTQAGRVISGGTTYLQNPGVNLELEYKLRPTDTFVFNVSPQVNIVQASPADLDANGNQLATDNLPAYVVNPNDPTKQVLRQVNGAPVTPRYLDRKAPNTYQGLLEARYKKQLRRLTALEFAVGANLLYQSVPQVFTGATDEEGRLRTDAKGKPLTDDNPFGLSRLPRAPTNVQFNVLPVGEVLLNQEFATGNARGRLIAFSRADAWLNTVSGEIGARSATVAALNLDFGLDALRAQVAFIQSLPLTTDTTAFRQVTSEVAYERELTRSWFFDVGARLGYQSAAFARKVEGQPDPFSSSFLQPGAFAGIAWRPLPAKL